MRRTLRRSWLVARSVSTLKGLYGLLPQRTRRWIEGAIIWSLVGLAVAGLTAAVGAVRHIDPFWLGLASLGTFASAIWLGERAMRMVHWVSTRTSLFEVRPICGEGFTLLDEPETYAHLAVLNRGGFAKKWSARLMAVIPVQSGRLLSEPQWAHSGLQPRLLRWSSRELSAHGDHHQWLDIPDDGAGRWLDVAVVDGSQLDRFTMVSADEKDRPSFPPGWYKVVIKVASESETARTTDVQLLLGLHPRDGGVPAPLELYDWHPRGKRLLAA
jgi:hypothetical protein